MEVFWSNDDVDTSEKENKRLQTNAKKSNMVAKEKMNNPLREKMKSAVRKRNEQMRSQTPGSVTGDEGKVMQKQVTLKDLCPEDKQRVADLVKELARLGEEKENAMSQLAQQKAVYEEQAKALAKEKEKMKLDREAVELQLRECQLLLDKYQRFLSEQQDKQIFAKGNAKKDHLKPKLLIKENETGVPERITRMEIQSSKPNHQSQEETSRICLGGTPRNPETGSGNQAPNMQSTVSCSSGRQGPLLSAGAAVLSSNVPYDHFTGEEFSFQRPTTAVASRDIDCNLLLHEQTREPTFLSGSLLPKKSTMIGPVDRPDLSSTRVSEYMAEGQFPTGMQLDFGNDQRSPVPILTHDHMMGHVISANPSMDMIYGTISLQDDRRLPATFLAKPKTSNNTDRMTLNKKIESSEANTWPPMSHYHNNRHTEEANEVFLLQRTPDDYLQQHEKSRMELSSSGIPVIGENGKQGRVGMLNVEPTEQKEVLLAQRKALMDEQRCLNDAILGQEAFLKKQEQKLQLLQRAQHSMEVQSSDNYESKREEFCCLSSDSSHQSEKPVRIVDANMSVSRDQHTRRLVSTATSPVRLQSPRALSVKAGPQGDRSDFETDSQSLRDRAVKNILMSAAVRSSTAARHPQVTTSSSAEELKKLRPPRSSKPSRETLENEDGEKFQRTIQRNKIVPVELSRASVACRRVAENNHLKVRSSELHNDDDSDSSFEDSKIIEDLFFIK